ncbi:MAG: hypothetical protein Q8O67_25065 [Deltaproteobacteria bacterium]|nr:hypothetical protein [Deltaproteobacteria bacterium]
MPDAVDVVAKGIADAFVGLGVQTRLQLQGAPPDGSPRSDVALWLPDLHGQTQPPDPKAAAARVHVALVVDPTSSPRTLARFDALLVPCERLLPAVREAVQKSPRAPAILSVRLCGQPPAADAERVERGFSGKRVVVVDVRAASAAGDDLERTVVQLALRSNDAALVLAAPADEAIQRRLRELCQRHLVDAWLAAGPDALSSTMGVADLIVGTPSWDEILLSALYRTPLALLPPASGAHAPLAAALRDAGVVDDVMGTLQLAAAIDRRLYDPGATAARGLALGEALFSTEKALYDALASVEPLPGTHAPSSRWEPIGPHADKATQPAAQPVLAVDPNKPVPPSPAQKIEDDLAALKAKLRAGV